MNTIVINFWDNHVGDECNNCDCIDCINCEYCHKSIDC